jgi:hypothetical protein
MSSKLTRKQIKEGLADVPMDILLLGHKSDKLTTKQKDFAKNLALGDTGAEAYRKSYRKGKPPIKAKVAGNRASNLKKHEGIMREAEAIKRAIEFNKSHTMAQLRALVVSQLTREALDDDNPPASRLTALRALGEVSGVDAFIHRTETKIIKDSDQARSDLMDQLKKAISDNMRTIDSSDGDPLELLSEIEDGRKAKAETENPPHPTPQESPAIDGDSTHSIPHKSSPKVSESTHAPVSFRKEEGVGGTKIDHLLENADTETPPVTNWKAKG